MKIFILESEMIPAFNSLYPEGYEKELMQEDHFVIGALEEVDGSYKPAGIMSVISAGTSLIIEYLNVIPELRRKGIATNMLDRFMLCMNKSAFTEINMVFGQHTEGMEAFLKHFGYDVFYTGYMNRYYIKLEDLETIAGAQVEDVEPLMLTSQEQREAFIKYLDDTDTPVEVLLPLEPSDYSPFSACCMKNGHIISVLFVEVNEEEEKTVIRIPWIEYMTKFAPSVAYLFNVVIRSLKETYSGDSRVMFDVSSPKMNQLISSLVPDAEIEEKYIATWMM